MLKSSRLSRILLIGGAAFALMLAALWWRSQRAASEIAQVDKGSMPTAAAGTDAVLGFSVRLLPDGGISAQPSSVRIGLASVSPDDEAAYRAWLRSGREGAGPRAFTDLATVVRWINVPAELRSDGSVQVGPMPLPAAQRYVLQARAGDGLRFYEATFTRDDAPMEVRPWVAAGLRVRAPRGAAGVGVLFRRVEGSQDAEWQSLLRRDAAAVLDAFDERAIPVIAETAAGTTAGAAAGTAIAPLPPGPLDVVAVVNGIETERRRITLIAGRYASLDLDPDASELGAALATTLLLRLIEADSGAPIRDAIAVWPSPRGEVRARPDAAGAVRIEGADMSEAMLLELRFDPGSEQKGMPPLLAKPRTAAALPRWPERVPLSIDLTDERANSGVVEKTVKLRPLHWLIVETQGLQISERQRVGDAFPVFVLQRIQGTQWRDAPADYFRPIDEGMAVSLDAPGRVRVAAVLSPWQVVYSDVLESRLVDERQRVRLRTEPGRSTTLRLSADGRPLAFAPVQIVSALRGVPPKTVTTDGAGRIVLPNVSVPAVHIEPPGFEQVEVRLDRAEANISLRRSAG
jgi:hypothetical protein